MNKIIQKHNSQQCLQVVNMSVAYFGEGEKVFIAKVETYIAACQYYGGYRHTDNYAAKSFDYYCCQLNKVREEIVSRYEKEKKTNKQLVLAFLAQAVELVLKEFSL